jgi:hypothetical protein
VIREDKEVNNDDPNHHIGRPHRSNNFAAVTTIHSQSILSALHALRALKLPSVALYVVETTFKCGFESHSLRHIFILARPTKSRTRKKDRDYGGFQDLVLCADILLHPV